MFGNRVQLCSNGSDGQIGKALRGLADLAALTGTWVILASHDIGHGASGDFNGGAPEIFVTMCKTPPPVNRWILSPR